jgi:hypothetical protein
MAPFTLDVPAELVEAMHEALESASVVAVDAVHALDRGGEESPGRAWRHDAAEIRGLLEQIGWDDHRPGQPVRLVGDRVLLTEAVRAAVALVGERLAGACMAILDGGTHLTEDAIESYGRLGALLDLLIVCVPGGER